MGDEDQSIYSFKHANRESLLSIPRTLEPTMSSWHCAGRCPSLVIELANALIAHNTTRSDRQLRPLGGAETGEVVIAQWSDIHSEARGVVAFIAGRIKSGQLAPGDILLLAPRQEIGREVMRELGAAGVPGRSFFAEQELAGNPRKLLGSEAQQTFTLLSIAVEPTDPVSLRCWIGFGSPSLRHNEWERIRALCLTNGQSPADMLVGLSSGKSPYITPPEREHATFN